MVFPLIKLGRLVTLCDKAQCIWLSAIFLGYLAVRQVSKPLANQIKVRAKTSPTLSKYVCIPVAQVYHRTEQIFKMALLGLGRPVNILPLNEQMVTGVLTGINFLQKFLIFSLIILGNRPWC